TEDPFFAGYPFEFWFDQVTDEEHAATLSLGETVEWLNARIDGLDLEPVQLPELVKHAKSNKIGVFIDGAPRKADYFKDAGQPESTAGGGPFDESSEGLLVTDKMDDETRSGIAAAVSSFSDAVAAADLVFLGANSHLPRAFLAALVAKRFAILSGLSGSGKTQLARSLGQWL